MLEVALLCRLLLAGVFLVSGSSKLLDRAATREAVEAFGVPARWAPAVAALLPPVELLVAVLLLTVASPLAGPLAALLLIGLFTAAVVENLRRGRRPQCHCFGRIGSSDISGRTVVRNAALAGGAAAALTSPVSVGSYLDAFGALALVLHAVVAAAVVAALLGAEARSGHRRAEQQAAAHAEQFLSELEDGMDRRPAPEFSLAALTGATATLADLLADGRPLLLTFLSPGCGPCKRLRPYVARWSEVFSDRVRVAAVVSGSRGANLGSFGDAGFPVLLDEDRWVSAEYGVVSRPSAVVVAPDGRLVGPVASGDLSVRRLLDALLSGHLAPHAPDVPATALGLTSSPSPRATVTTTREGANLLVVDETSGARVTLDGVGAIVWQCLDGRSSLDEIVQDIAEEFRAPRERVAEDVLGLVVSLGRMGLLAGVAADLPEEALGTHPDHAHRSTSPDLVGSS